MYDRPEGMSLSSSLTFCPNYVLSPLVVLPTQFLFLLIELVGKCLLL